AITEERARLTAPPAPQPEPPRVAPVAETALESLQPMPAAPPPAMQPVFARVAEPAEPLDPIPPTITPIPEPVVETPRRSFGEMLTAFMEERSIRWGELIGGLLIIGCSIALVVSLWSEIASRPLLKFSLSSTMTAGLFGLGFYSAHRWKLPTTSQG